MTSSAPLRLVQVDALRGLAALLVVVYHYTWRFDELYPGPGERTVAVPFGHLGVQLFFTISGFVIPLTLQRTTTALDFIVSRCARLLPAYWVAVLLTFGMVTLLGLPGRQVQLGEAVINLTMVQRLVGVPSVDGVYWTLTVELLFYGWALALWRVAGPHFRPRWLVGWIALQALWLAGTLGWHVTVPHTVAQLLLLPYLHTFAVGIALQAVHAGRWSPQTLLWVVLWSLTATWLQDGALACGFALFFAFLLVAAVHSRLPTSVIAPLLWVGAVSYPLYLLHQNLGYLALRNLRALGPDLASLLVLSGALLLAMVVHRWVEQPAQQFVRRAWARYRTKA